MKREFLPSWSVLYSLFSCIFTLKRYNYTTQATQLNCTEAQTANPVQRMFSIIGQVQFRLSRVPGIPSIPLPPPFISHRKWMCVLPCHLIFIHRRSLRRRALKDHLWPVFPALPSVSPVMSQSRRVLSYGCSASIIHSGGTRYCGMIPKSELNRSKN